jgi:hypothetical protein
VIVPNKFDVEFAVIGEGRSPSGDKTRRNVASAESSHCLTESKVKIVLLCEILMPVNSFDHLVLRHV